MHVFICVKCQIGTCALGSARAWRLPRAASLQAAGIASISHNNFSLKASMAPVLCQQRSLRTTPKHTRRLCSGERALAFIHLPHKHVCAARAEPLVLPVGEASQCHGLWSTARWLPSPYCLPFTRCSHCQGQNSSACAGMLPEHSK